MRWSLYLKLWQLEFLFFCHTKSTYYNREKENLKFVRVPFLILSRTDIARTSGSAPKCVGSKNQQLCKKTEDDPAILRINPTFLITHKVRHKTTQSVVLYIACRTDRLIATAQRKSAVHINIIWSFHNCNNCIYSFFSLPLDMSTLNF